MSSQPEEFFGNGYNGYPPATLAGVGGPPSQMRAITPPFVNAGGIPNRPPNVEYIPHQQHMPDWMVNMILPPPPPPPGPNPTPNPTPGPNPAPGLAASLAANLAAQLGPAPPPVPYTVPYPSPAPGPNAGSVIVVARDPAMEPVSPASYETIENSGNDLNEEDADSDDSETRADERKEQFRCIVRRAKTELQTMKNNWRDIARIKRECFASDSDLSDELEEAEIYRQNKMAKISSKQNRQQGRFQFAVMRRRRENQIQHSRTAGRPIAKVVGRRRKNGQQKRRERNSCDKSGSGSESNSAAEGCSYGGEKEVEKSCPVIDHIQFTARKEILNHKDTVTFLNDCHICKVVIFTTDKCPTVKLEKAKMNLSIAKHKYFAKSGSVICDVCERDDEVIDFELAKEEVQNINGDCTCRACPHGDNSSTAQ